MNIKSKKEVRSTILFFMYNICHSVFLLISHVIVYMLFEKNICEYYLFFVSTPEPPSNACIHAYPIMTHTDKSFGHMIYT